MSRSRFLRRLWLCGALGGVVFGLAYWYGWGCRNCAKDTSPVALVLFCGVVGAGMARAWGPDHLPPR